MAAPIGPNRPDLRSSGVPTRLVLMCCGTMRNTRRALLLPQSRELHCWGCLALLCIHAM